MCKLFHPVNGRENKFRKLTFIFVGLFFQKKKKIVNLITSPVRFIKVQPQEAPPDLYGSQYES
jgi:hypothetical protein